MPTEKTIQAVAEAVMIVDGCGYTLNEERLLCDDPRLEANGAFDENCGCKRSAKAAIKAYQESEEYIKKQQLVNKQGDGIAWLMVIAEERKQKLKLAEDALDKVRSGIREGHSRLNLVSWINNALEDIQTLTKIRGE